MFQLKKPAKSLKPLAFQKQNMAGQILKMVAQDFVLLFTAGMVKNMMSTVMNIRAKPAH
jgi:Rod binding domain-containing protein